MKLTKENADFNFEFDPQHTDVISESSLLIVGRVNISQSEKGDVFADLVALNQDDQSEVDLDLRDFQKVLEMADQLAETYFEKCMQQNKRKEYVKEIE